MSKLEYYLKEALEPTLMYAALCSVLGIIAASYYYKVSLAMAILLVIGVFFAQMSVNVIDDYVDYKRGIDSETEKTKFSGGSGILVNHLLEPREVLYMGLTAFMIAASIGSYLIALKPAIMPFVAVGALSILLYAHFFVNIPYLAEPLAATNFMLIVLGSFVVAGSLTHLLAALLVAFPTGSLVGLALLVNEIPDRDVDAKHGRRSGVVMLNSREKSASYYIIWQALCYGSVVYGVAAKILPYTELLLLAALPFMVVTYSGIRRYSKAREFEKYMGTNALHSLLVPMLLMVGYVMVIV
ncbi:MAG: prenyltransferase [Candidatus Micrarchaeota archaeon]|nr:prenyltransferase [Candidatus Micrarchaeota archaeon]